MAVLGGGPACSKVVWIQELIKQADQAMTKTWEDLGDKMLWNLNCLMYAGAKVVID